ncbi:MAG TPA: cation:proton antiporter [Gaiellales bacterium]|nr:cation:proton antiporter [Gaiellales bacterium]
MLTLIAGCGLAGPVLSAATRLALPVVVGEIIAGLVIGRTGFGVLDLSDPTLIFLSAVGFAMLMFVVGTRLPLRDERLRRALGRAVAATVLSFLVAAAIGWVIADASGIHHPALFLLLLAASSAAVVMPVLQERGLTSGPMLEVTAWVALVDVATIVAVPLALTPGRAIRIIAGGAAVTAAAVAVYLVIRALRHNPTVALVRGYSRDRRWAFDLRLSLVVLFGLAALAARFGTSTLVAGFAAGMIVAWAGEPERLSGQLLGVAEGFFVPLFFVTLGAQLNFRSLGSSHRDAALAAGLAACIVACHLLVAVVMRMPWPSGLLASAQLGLPAAVVALGMAEHLIGPGTAAAIVLAALISLGACSLGAALLARRVATP